MIERRKYLRQKSYKLNGWYDTVLPKSKYTSTYSDLTEDMDDWDCSVWMLYHKRNKDLGGSEYAYNLIESETQRVGYFSDLGLCFKDCDFIEYFRSEGFTVGTFLGDLICDFTGTVKGVTGSAKNIAANTESLTKYIIPLAAIGGGLLLYNEYDKRKK